MLSQMIGKTAMKGWSILLTIAYFFDREATSGVIFVNKNCVDNTEWVISYKIVAYNEYS